MKKVSFPIHHTFGPMVTEQQWKLAWKLQFRPWKWRQGIETEKLRSELTTRFGRSAALFSTGRESLLAALRALELIPGEEVIIQGYTCVVVANAIHAAQGVPVYADIDSDTLNLSVERIQRAITPRTRAIICQHTFGIPADTARLRSICDKRGLALIEDCAHIIPESSAHAHGVGVHGDIVICSFGRDKAISGVTGGAALTRHPMIAERLVEIEKSASHLPRWQIMHYIEYPLRYQFAKWIWGTRLAKGYLRWMRLIGFLPPIITSAERKGQMEIVFHKMPNACCSFALEQLKNIAEINDERRRLSKLYADKARESGWSVPAAALSSFALLKFPVFASDADQIRADLKREQVYLDDGWCGAVVNPRTVDQEAAGYQRGSCPVSEDVATHILSLPTHVTTDPQQVEYVISGVGSRISSTV